MSGTAKVIVAALVVLAWPGELGAGVPSAAEVAICRPSTEAHESPAPLPAVPRATTPNELRLAQYGAAYRCFTQIGWCPLAYPLPVGGSCYCPSIYGPVWGIAG